MNKNTFLAECIGTFALIFIGAGAAATGAGGLVGIALAHGLVLLSYAYTFGHISGTHINPAVTFGVALAGEMPWTKALYYWVAQFLGGILGAAALLLIFGGASNGLGATVLADGVTPFQGIVTEAILTFFLVEAVLFGAVRGESGNFAGLVIGFTLTFSILLGGPLTGASLNPARTLGPALFTGTLNQFWIYGIGTLSGAVMAVVVDSVIETE